MKRHNPRPPNPATRQRTKLVTRIEFVEINDDGQPIGKPKQFDIEGDLVYIDYLRVTFDDKYIEESDLDRSTAICLFQRIFGEHQEPIDGFQLDDVGTRPTAYARGTEMSDFERKIWGDFWSIANDPQAGGRNGHPRRPRGRPSAMRVQPGKTYEIELRSTGDMTIRPSRSREVRPSELAARISVCPQLDFFTSFLAPSQTHRPSTKPLPATAPSGFARASSLRASRFRRAACSSANHCSLST